MLFFTVTHKTTAEELRQHYKALCKKYHPDMGGNNAIQAQINVEYQQTMKQMAEMEACIGNTVSYERLVWQMEQHMQKIMEHVKENKGLYYSILSNVSVPLIRRVVPKQYQLLAMGVFKLAKLVVKN